MVLEIARIRVAEGHQANFEAAFQEAKVVLASSPGFRSATFRHCVEDPASYFLLVEWETLEAHTVDFRGSERFQRWRQLIGPHFDGPPDVVHATLVAEV
jgi:heme-degrading monooxygenase HmoA